MERTGGGATLRMVWIAPCALAMGASEKKAKRIGRKTAGGEESFGFIEALPWLKRTSHEGTKILICVSQTLLSLLTCNEFTKRKTSHLLRKSNLFFLLSSLRYPLDFGFENHGIIMNTPNRLSGKIRRILEGMDVGDSPDRDALRKLVKEMPKGPRERILRSALRSYFEAEALKPYQSELIKLQAYLEERGRKAIILFDGRDASGKGGTLRRVTRYMNEKHYRVVALGKPSEYERTELHMKRYIKQFPHAGEIVLFDRSWYNRAMVEPVMGFCTPKQYREFMREVLDYEESFIADGKTTLLKLYFSVSKKEQQKRFDRRKNDPLRAWKLSEVDLQAQELWDEFTEKKYELLRKTHTDKTPWYVIRSDNKHLARLETMKLILRSMKIRGRSRSLEIRPNPKIVIPGDKELKNMKRERRRHGKAKR